MALQTTTLLTDVILKKYARQLLFSALPVMRWLPFAVKRMDLTRQPGESIVFTKYDDLSGDPVLTEGVTIATGALGTATVEVTVGEYGKGEGVSELALIQSFDDVLHTIALLLGRHYATWGPERKVMLDAIQNAGTVKYGNGAASRTALTSVDVMDVDLIRDCVETLQSNDVPKFVVNGDDFYVAQVHPHQLRHLKDDPDWVAANNYHQTRGLFNGEAGRIEDVVFISSSACPQGTATSTQPGFYDVDANSVNDLASGEAGNLTDIYTGLVFGDHYVAYAEALPVELRDNGVIDFGREHELAWYSVYGTKVIEPTHGVRIETA